MVGAGVSDHVALNKFLYHLMIALLIHQRTIDTIGPWKRQAAILYPEVLFPDFFSGILRMPSTLFLFMFETFAFGNSLFVSRRLALQGTIQKSILHVHVFLRE